MSSIELAAALAELARSHFVRPAYKLIAPNHVLADPVFASLEEIPQSGVLYDTDHDPFDPQAADVVQVFLLTQHV